MKKPIDFTEYVLEFSNLPKALNGTTICHLSDLHSGRIADYSTCIADGIRARKPDCILCSGDMIDCAKDRSGQYFFSILDQLNSEIPVVCSPGNHERRIGGEGIPETFAEKCRERGIPYLDNAMITLPVRGAEIRIFGYLQEFVSFQVRHELRSRLRQNVTGEDLTAALGECPAEGMSVLLAHDPMMFPAYAEWGAPLTLSGHLHGGQVRLPLVGGLLSPARRFFPKYDAGVFRCGTSTLVVSRGLSVSEMPRFRNKPEVVFLCLKCSAEKR